MNHIIINVKFRFSKGFRQLVSLPNHNDVVLPPTPPLTYFISLTPQPSNAIFTLYDIIFQKNFSNFFSFYFLTFYFLSDLTQISL